jgi:uncharacterized membrane protein YcaP (DUF421 family)
MNRRNMRRELLTFDELMSELRGQSIDDISAVKRAFLEHDGTLSVLKKQENDASPAPPERSRRGAV